MQKHVFDGPKIFLFHQIQNGVITVVFLNFKNLSELVINKAKVLGMFSLRVILIFLTNQHDCIWLCLVSIIFSS